MFTRSRETRGVYRILGLGLIPLSDIGLLNLQSNQETCILAYRHSLPLGQSFFSLLRLEMRSHLLVQDKLERESICYEQVLRYMTMLSKDEGEVKG